MKLQLLYLIFSLVVLSVSCSDTKDKKLAKVYGHTLYNSQIDYNSWEMMDELDSTTMKNIFTEHWIRKNLLLHNAEISSEDKKTIDELTKEYRNSLIIDFYENAIIKEKLDTSISDEEMKEYYNLVKNDFKLEETALNLRFIKLIADKKTIDKIKQLWSSGKYKSILDYITLRPEECVLDGDFWILKKDIEKIIPKSLFQEQSSFQTQKNINGTEYFLKVTGARYKNDFFPLPLVRDELRELILKKRKTDLIDNFITELYQKETKNNNVKIYD